MGKKRNYKLRITTRDRKILIFLWRWKYASTSLIHTAVFHKASLATCYNRLLKLKKEKYILREPIVWNEGFAWKLSRKGLAVIENEITEMENFGWGGENPRHDFLVSAVHLGEWARSRPTKVGLIAEQQIRRHHKSMLPDFLPKNGLCRPDGYWIYMTEGRESAIALEVELSRKMDSRYVNSKTFYNTASNIEKCIWIVPTIKFAKRVSKLHVDSRTKDKNKHQFFLVDDVLENAWESICVHGSNKGSSLRDLLYEFARESPIETPSISIGKDILKTGISYKKSTT